MTRIRLVHWHAGEAEARIERLEAAGYRVDFDALTNGTLLRRVTERLPDAVVIDLSRLPAQGRDVGLWLRRRTATRHTPIVFVGGDAEKVARIKKLLPDAVYTEWRAIVGAVKRALAHPPRAPVVPASSLAGYSGTPLVKKLGIKPGTVVALINAPEDFERTLGELPEGTTLRSSGRGKRDLTIYFVSSGKGLKRRMGRLVSAAEQGSVWIAWPKKASGVASDVGEREVRAAGLDAGLVDYKICAIDETWSGLLFARRRDD